MPRPRAEAMKLIVLLSVTLLAGCATFKNTPRQDYVWEMAARCRAPSAGTGAAYVDRVDPECRWWMNTQSDGWRTDRPKLSECMQEQFKATAYRQWFERHKGEY